MKIMRVQKDDQAPAWAIAEGDDAYALEGDRFTAPTKGAPIGPIAGLKVLSPIMPENKVVIILDNWRGRNGRYGPTFIIKSPSARINPGETVVYPKMVTKFYFETEVGVVIGKKARNVSVEQAGDHIMGYTIHNDMTAFDFNIDLGAGMDKVVFGKSFDTFSCAGPAIVTGLDPARLTMRGKINGEEFFETSSGLMNWTVQELVSWVSQAQTLNPGDIISCGAPPGALLRETLPGDRTSAIIDEIGVMENNVVAQA
jgi:2-keto-4-pentenoate hydratase/2-oxohepta-3-ene-1,7-dioic acid hydratase in catechol pathway